MVDDGIAGKREEPGRKLRARAVAADVLLDADKNLLRDVIRLSSVAQHPVNEFHHEPPVAPQQFIKGGGVAGLNLLDKL
jgi:hypothetical protein